MQFDLILVLFGVFQELAIGKEIVAFCADFDVFFLNLFKGHLTFLIALEQMLHLKGKMFHYHVKLGIFIQDHSGLYLALNVDRRWHTVRFPEEDQLFLANILEHVLETVKFAPVWCFRFEELL
jgi:hypothetical protein